MKWSLPSVKRLVSFLIVALLALLLTGCDGSQTVGALTSEQAQETLAALLTKVTTHDMPLRMDISGTELSSPGAELPDIANYPLSVTGQGQVTLEIMASTEKAGAGMDGWLNTVAENFNKEGQTLGNGKTVAISIRPVASGLALEYITTGRHMPDVFSPANELWGQMGLSVGVKMERVKTRLAGNTAGILTPFP